MNSTLPPARKIPLRYGMVTILLGGFFLFMSAWPYYIDLRLPGLGGLNPQRVILLILTFIVLGGLAFDSAFGNRFYRALMTHRLIISMFCAFFFIRFLTSVVRGSPQSIVVAAYEIPSNLLLLVLTAFLARWQENRDLILKVIIISGVFVLCSAVVEGVVKQNFFLRFAGGEERRVIESLGTEILRDGKYRVRGIFENPLTLTHYLIMYIPFVLIAGFYFRWRWFSILLLFLSLLSVIFTWSRSGLLLMILVLGVFAVSRIRDRIVRVLVVLLITLFSVSVFFVSDQPLSADFFESYARKAQLVNGILAIADRPILGYGVSNQIGEVIYGKSLMGRDALLMWESNATTTDNRYLTIALESGLPSLGLFIAAVLLILKKGLKASRRWGGEQQGERNLMVCFVLSAFASLVVMSILSIYTVHPFFYIVLGLILGTVAGEAESGIRFEKARPWAVGV